MTDKSIPKLRFASYVATVTDVFASDLAAVENLGSCVRLTFAVPRQSGNDAYLEPVAAVVIPKAAIADMQRRLSEPPRKIQKGADFEETGDAEEAAHDQTHH